MFLRKLTQKAHLLSSLNTKQWIFLPQCHPYVTDTWLGMEYRFQHELCHWVQVCLQEELHPSGPSPSTEISENWTRGPQLLLLASKCPQFQKPVPGKSIARERFAEACLLVFIRGHDTALTPALKTCHGPTERVHTSDMFITLIPDQFSFSLSLKTEHGPHLNAHCKSD